MSSNNKNKVIKTVTVIAACTFISKILGLLRDVITASKFGAGSELDAFFAASNIPMILFITIGAAITTTLIPLYNEKLKTGRQQAIDFVNNVLNFFIIITFGICLLCIIINKFIVSMLNPGFSGAQLILTQKLTVILIPTLIINAVLYIFNGVLQSENNFAVPALVALPFNILIIAYLMFYGKKFGVEGLTVITLIATAIQIIPQLSSIKKIGFRFKLKVDFGDPMLKKMGIMLVPVIIGTGVQQINSFIERGVATHFQTGSLSALSYAYRVFALIVDIFVVAIATVVYPKMAQQTALDKIEDMKETLSKSIKALVVFILPMSLIVIVQSRPIVYILFERGEFRRESTIVTANILLFYSIGLLAFGLRDFICKAYYTLKDTKTPMINSAIALGLNIVLIYFYKSFMGLNGLALANATSMYIACLLLIYNLRKKIGSINGKSIFITIVKTAAASLIMVITIIYVNRIINLQYVSTLKVLVKITISSAAGILVFIICAWFIKLEEIIQVKNLILRKR